MLSRKRLLLSGLLAHAGVPGMRLRLTSSRDRLTVLAYHRVYDLGDEDRFPFDPELVSASNEDFRWQMAFVRRHFNVVGFATLLESLRGGPPLPPRALIVTFDDGHRDNYECAFPVLRELGVAATIFLSTGYIDGREPFWFDRVAQLLYASPAGALVIRDIGYRAELADVRSRRAATERLLGELKALPNAKRLHVLEQLERLIAAPPAPAGSGALSWAQVREMSEQGVEFGSHTVTHPVLTNVDGGTLERELVESRRAIEAHTGKECRILAYPVGACEPRVVAASRRAGYALGVGYVSGINSMARFDPFDIRRLHVERYLSRAYFEAMLAFPDTFD